MTPVSSPTHKQDTGQSVIVWTLTELHFGSKYTDFIQGLGVMMEQVWREWSGVPRPQGDSVVMGGGGGGKYPDLHSITSLLGLPPDPFFLLLFWSIPTPA